ncbi:MAG: TetR/AcrR family transcriptional regulator [Hamadaea sp.]|nr:TetR/AcrR family transcriptional regulator [Hamadaea sp.]NUR52210.1 TetR/AcrR family transcriptional regulator [Hamadaea sp.]NUT02396.1 TetR/AcrR family transcriptional regulator [Hamadaea sp.]
MRADAQRNRDRLLTVAVEAFTGPDGNDVTLDSIAKQAGVGIGTLYRHFPTREALVEAAYRNEVDKLGAAALDLLGTLPPAEALREWMNHFVDYIATKRGMADALKTVVASGVNPYEHSRAKLLAALSSLLAAGAAEGSLRADVAAEDVLAALLGVTMSAGEPAQRDQAGRLLDLLSDGLRAR